MGKRKVAFTGHRPNKFSFGYDETDKECKRLKELLQVEIEFLIYQGYDYFITGMALGLDTWAAEIILKLKKENPDIKLEAAIPCKGQDSRWIKESRERYRRIIEGADYVTYVTEGTFDDNPSCMNIRNVYMVNQCDYLLAVYDGSKGGTQHAFDYAKKLGKGISRIHPELEISRIEAKEALRGGVLECSSIGDPRFSALYAYVDVFGRMDFIENHYQLSKRIGDKVPKNKWEFKGKEPSHFVVGGKEFDNSYLSSWYKLLWCKYLDANPSLVEYLKTFDDYTDKFKGKSINCQADVIRQYIKEGRNSVIKDCSEFINLLKSVSVDQK